jgi:hypothetical protein
MILRQLSLSHILIKQSLIKSHRHLICYAQVYQPVRINSWQYGSTKQMPSMDKDPSAVACAGGEEREFVLWH